MPAPEGNTYNKLCKTQRQRRSLFKKWQKHIESGFSEGSFPECCPKTLKKYIEEYPEDFPSDKMHKSYAQGLKILETALLGQISGAKTFRYGKSDTLKFVLINRYRQYYSLSQSVGVSDVEIKIDKDDSELM